ncbi:hypothetical protein KM043_000019, partial [Ampulex compressa]
MPKILAGKTEKRKIKRKKKAEPAAEMPEETMTEFPASDEEEWSAVVSRRSRKLTAKRIIVSDSLESSET